MLVSFVHLVLCLFASLSHSHPTAAQVVPNPGTQRRTPKSYILAWGCRARRGGPPPASVAASGAPALPPNWPASRRRANLALTPPLLSLRTWVPPPRRTSAGGGGRRMNSKRNITTKRGETAGGVGCTKKKKSRGRGGLAGATPHHWALATNQQACPGGPRAFQILFPSGNAPGTYREATYRSLWPRASGTVCCSDGHPLPDCWSGGEGGRGEGKLAGKSGRSPVPSGEYAAPSQQRAIECLQMGSPPSPLFSAPLSRSAARDCVCAPRADVASNYGLVAAIPSSTPGQGHRRALPTYSDGRPFPSR